MARSVAEEMMNEFLQRQNEYDKIYRTYRTYEHMERRIHSLQSINNQPHKIRDAVRKAHKNYIESFRSLQNIKKNESQKIIRNSSLNERPPPRKIYQQNQQIDIGFVLIIAIPIIFFLTILSELV